jgi:glycosyltransferase involved in cell wall biosynthesis
MNGGAENSVSVIIPVYNRAGIIRTAAESVLRQVPEVDELIVVDDGSSDNPAEALEALADPRVRTLRLPARRGAAAARNAGIRVSSGGLIAFCDSDDAWLPGKLAAQIREFSRGGGIVCTEFYVAKRGGPQRRRLGSRYSFEDIARGCFLSPGTTMMVKRSVFDEVGVFREELARLEDWEWLLRASRLGDVLVVNTPLATIEPSPGGHPSAVNEALLAVAAAMQSQPNVSRQAIRRFRSAVRFERAALAFREGSTVRGAVHLCASMAQDPGKIPGLVSRYIW